MFCCFVHRRIKFGEQSAVAFGPYRLVWDLCRVGRAFANYLPRISGVRPNGCGFLPSFDYNLPHLFRGLFGASIPTAPADGQGYAVEARVVTAVLRFRGVADTIAPEAQE